LGRLIASAIETDDQAVTDQLVASNALDHRNILDPLGEGGRRQNLPDEQKGHGQILTPKTAISNRDKHGLPLFSSCYDPIRIDYAKKARKNRASIREATSTAMTRPV
jgi:hypothetical protein